MSIELIIFTLVLLLEIWIVIADITICRRTERRLRTCEAAITVMNIRLSLFKERLDILQDKLKRREKEE